MSKNFFIVILCVIAFWTLVRGITGLWSANIEQDIFISMKKSKLSEERGSYWKNKSYVMQYSNEKYGFDFFILLIIVHKTMREGLSFGGKTIKVILLFWSLLFMIEKYFLRGSCVKIVWMRRRLFLILEKEKKHSGRCL